MRVLVTRPRDDAEATAKRLAELGHEPVIAPLLEIVPEPAGPDLADAGALILTSANALWALRSAGGLGRVPRLPVYAVGAHTAAAAREAGFADVRSAEGDADGLAERIIAAPPGGRLVHLAGRDRAGDLVARLASAGLDARAQTVYRAEAADSLPAAAADAIRKGEIDAILHYSRRSAEAFVRLAVAAGLACEARAAAHLCLSAAVAAPLRAAGFGNLLVAAAPDEQELLHLLPLAADGDSARK